MVLDIMAKNELQTRKLLCQISNLPCRYIC